MFTLPPIESASMSGVGAFVTSIVSTKFKEACSNSKARPVFAEAELATLLAEPLCCNCDGPEVYSSPETVSCQKVEGVAR